METRLQVEIRSAEGWRAWLAGHYEQKESIWLVVYKKSVPEFHVSWEEVVEEALCFGWIDSRVRKLDERRSMVLVSPRNPKSNWSRVNKRLVEKLEAEGRLAPSGIAAIDRAKANGTWTALDEVEDLIIPADLLAELNRVPGSLAAYESFPRSAKRAALEWLLTAKTVATRERRIAKFVQEALAGRRVP